MAKSNTLDRIAALEAAQHDQDADWMADVTLLIGNYGYFRSFPDKHDIAESLAEQLRPYQRRVDLMCMFAGVERFDLVHSDSRAWLDTQRAIVREMQRCLQMLDDA